MADKLMQLIDLLVDNREPPSSDWLAELSDLNQADVEILSEHWGDIPPEMRKLMLLAIGKLADDDFMLSFEALNRFAISDAVADVRRLAIRNLWESEDHHVIPTLISVLLDDPSPHVRSAAAKALGPFVLYGESDGYPGQFLVDIEDALLQSLTMEGEGSIRCRCIESLGYSSRAEVEQLVLNAYTSGDKEQIQSAIVAMGRSADKRWAEYISSNLHSHSPALRREAAVAAGELQLREAVPELIELLDDVEPDVWRAAMWSISEIGGTLATEALNSLMENAEDEDQDVEYLQDALDNLEFVNSMRNLVPYDGDEEQDSPS